MTLRTLSTVLDDSYGVRIKGDSHYYNFLSELPAEYMDRVIETIRPGQSNHIDDGEPYYVIKFAE